MDNIYVALCTLIFGITIFVISIKGLIKGESGAGTATVCGIILVFWAITGIIPTL